MNVDAHPGISGVSSGNSVDQEGDWRMNDELSEYLLTVVLHVDNLMLIIFSSEI